MTTKASVYTYGPKGYAGKMLRVIADAADVAVGDEETEALGGMFDSQFDADYVRLASESGGKDAYYRLTLEEVTTTEE